MRRAEVRFLKLGGRRMGAAIVLGGLLTIGSAYGADPSVTPNEVRRAQLVNLVRQDCGSCHGMHLTGGLGPALTPQALRGKPVAGLAATILHGRAKTAMPPWRTLLTEAEAGWIAEVLLKGLPDER